MVKKCKWYQLIMNLLIYVLVNMEIPESEISVWNIRALLVPWNIYFRYVSTECLHLSLSDTISLRTVKSPSCDWEDSQDVWLE